MRFFASPLLLALVIALLSPSLASAQTDADCVAVYDAIGTRVARAYHLPLVHCPSFSKRTWLYR